MPANSPEAIPGTPTLALVKSLSRYFGAARFAYKLCGPGDPAFSISIIRHEPWPFPVWGCRTPSDEQKAKLSAERIKRGLGSAEGTAQQFEKEGD